MTDWTPEEARFAQAEGWDIFYTYQDLGHPEYELQRLDDPAAIDYLDYDDPLFDSDEEAWRFVVDRATTGHSRLHQQALDFLREHSPEEYEDVMRVGSGPTN